VTRAARALVVIAIGVVVASWPTTASAHPLGNFTINVHGGVVVRSDEILVDYVVDMAEIPAFRERRTIDADLDDRIAEDEALAYRRTMCSSLADGLTVRVGGRAVPLVASDLDALSFPPGTGGLTTLRLECRLEGRIDPIAGDTSISYVDRNFSDTLGWHEVTAVGDGVTLSGTDVPDVSPSRRLTAYPPDELPLDVRRMTTTAAPGGPRLAFLPTPGDAASGASTPDASRDGGPLAALVGRDEITPPLVLLMLAVAVGVGALHALGPGHGKTLIGAFLVGAGGTLRHAVGVGAAVSLMHTASVLGLGLLVLTAERVFAPERVYPVLGLVSGLIAIALGSALLVSRFRNGQDHRHPHDQGHDHDHGLDRGHAGAPLSRRSLLALAFSGGILPSPTALVVLLASVSLGRTPLGLALIAAFSLGLAGALIGVGIVTVRARDLAERRLTARALRLLPVASAVAIAGMGIFLTIRGAAQL
jgi:ABC-type nickel/cobalt efflux system permease component RcnA